MAKSPEAFPKPGDEKSEFSSEWSTSAEKGKGAYFTKETVGKMEGGIEQQKKAEEQVREEARFKQREDIIAGLLRHQVESNPKAIVDKERARKRWEGFYDGATQGEKMDMQINEAYAQQYEKGLEITRTNMLILEQKLILADNETEKKEISEKIRELQETISFIGKDIHARRGMLKPDSERPERKGAGGMSEKEFEEAKAHAKKMKVS